MFQFSIYSLLLLLFSLRSLLPTEQLDTTVSGCALYSISIYRQIWHFLGCPWVCYYDQSIFANRYATIVNAMLSFIGCHRRTIMSISWKKNQAISIGFIRTYSTWTNWNKQMLHRKTIDIFHHWILPTQLLTVSHFQPECHRWQLTVRYFNPLGIRMCIAAWKCISYSLCK